MADEYNEDKLKGQPVLAIKGARVNAFAGRSLSVGFAGRITINPVIEQAIELQKWWIETGQHMSAETLTTTRGEHGVSAKPRVTLSDIVEQNLGFDKSKPSGEFVDMRCWISTPRFGTFITVCLCGRPRLVLIRPRAFVGDTGCAEKARPPWYKACAQIVPDSCHGRPAENGATRECAKKVTPISEGGFVASAAGDSSSAAAAAAAGGSGGVKYACATCGVVETYIARYILSVQLRDSTGSSWATAFNDVSKVSPSFLPMHYHITDTDCSLCDDVRMIRC